MNQILWLKRLISNVTFVIAIQFYVLYPIQLADIIIFAPIL